MVKYDIIFESLRMKVDSGELSLEDAQILNDVAFEKYGEDDTEYIEVDESSIIDNIKKLKKNSNDEDEESDNESDERFTKQKIKPIKKKIFKRKIQDVNRKFFTPPVYQ